MYCICLYADEAEAQKFIERYPALTFDRFHGYVINVLEDSKSIEANCNSKVLEHLNISKSEAIAFGDGGNDIEMLQRLGVAMVVRS